MAGATGHSPSAFDGRLAIRTKPGYSVGIAGLLATLLRRHAVVAPRPQLTALIVALEAFALEVVEFTVDVGGLGSGICAQGRHTATGDCGAMRRAEAEGWRQRECQQLGPASSHREIGAAGSGIISGRDCLSRVKRASIVAANRRRPPGEPEVGVVHAEALPAPDADRLLEPLSAKLDALLRFTERIDARLSAVERAIAPADGAQRRPAADGEYQCADEQQQRRVAPFELSA